MENLFDELYRIILDRKKNSDPDKSYVAKLFSRGGEKIAQKVGEESVETVIAALSGTKEDLINESSDLLFHLLILWADKDVTPAEVIEETRSRMGQSGLDEKAARKMK